MRTPDNNQTHSRSDSLQERDQRTQKERSEQALSNLGSQDRKRSPANTRRDTLQEREDGEQ